MAGEELACACAYLTPVPTCEISTSTRNGKSFFSCAYAYFMPVPTRLFLCLRLCLCLSHKWEPGLKVGKYYNSVRLEPESFASFLLSITVTTSPTELAAEDCNF